jgi:hypothetical protein
MRDTNPTAIMFGLVGRRTTMGISLGEWGIIVSILVVGIIVGGCLIDINGTLDEIRKRIN